MPVGTTVVDSIVVVPEMVVEGAVLEVVVKTGGIVVEGVGSPGLKAIQVPRANRTIAPPPRSHRLSSRGRGDSSGLGDSSTPGLYSRRLSRRGLGLEPRQDPVTDLIADAEGGGEERFLPRVVKVLQPVEQ